MYAIDGEGAAGERGDCRVCERSGEGVSGRGRAVGRGGEGVGRVWSEEDLQHVWSDGDDDLVDGGRGRECGSEERRRGRRKKEEKSWDREADRRESSVCGGREWRVIGG